jgi:hypothetical protein
MFTYTDCYYDYLEYVEETYDDAMCLSDILTKEELEEMREDAYIEHFESPISMESLGLSESDF